MRDIGIGIIGGGYMGKAHAVAMSAVGAAFNTFLRPKLVMVAASNDENAERYRKQFGFAYATSDWRKLVADERVEAVIIATPPDLHLEITTLAFQHGKHVMCEKPLGASLIEGAQMVALAKEAHKKPRPLANMVGFNYIRTPAMQYISQLLQNGEIGDITYFRGEHVEDYYADPKTKASWRTKGINNGAMGDLAHVFNMAIRLVGKISKLNAELDTVHKTRIGQDSIERVENDDQGQLICRFENGAMGHLHFSRIATGRKMGYGFEIFGTKGAIRFDQEDQNAFWLYKTQEDPAQSGFRKILTGPAHPDYVNFNLGAGHGTGYQDQIIIEARDFLSAIETGEEIFPTFADGQEVNKVIAAIHASHNSGKWISL